MMMEVMMVNEDSNYYSEEDSNSRTSNTFFTEKELHKSPPSILPRQDDFSIDPDKPLNEDDLLLYDSSNLQYRGEGNSSLVIALKQEEKVIRILKKGNEKKESTSKQLSTQEKLMDLIDFQENVMRRIMNNNFLEVPKKIFLNDSQVTLINEIISKSSRPLHRLGKSIPNGTSTHALVLRDYCCLVKKPSSRYSFHGPVVSIEIKPKQGFLPSPESLPEEMIVKSQVSRFCLKQFHKMKRGRIGNLSRYCPLDLFSGCLSRQREALFNLLETPQNNLRIFQNQQLVFGDDQKDQERLQAVLAQTFDHQRDVKSVNHEEEDTTSSGSNRLNCLLQESFVNILLMILNRPSSRFHGNQRLPDKIKSIPVEESVCQLHQQSNNLCQDRGCRFHYLEGMSVLGSVYSAQRLDSVDSYRALEMARFMQKQNPQFMADLRSRRLESIGSPVRLPNESLEDFYFRKVWEYIVSLTAKDCSIMITIQRVTENTRSSISDIEDAVDASTEDDDVIENRSEFDMDLDSSSSDNESYAKIEKRRETVIEIKSPTKENKINSLANEEDIDLIYDEATGNYFSFSVAITDLDPKLPLTYPDLEKKIQEKDSLMIASFTEFLNNNDNHILHKKVKSNTNC